MSCRRSQLETKTMEIANRIAEKSPMLLRLAKEAIKVASRSNLDEGLRTRSRSVCTLLLKRRQRRGCNGVSWKSESRNSKESEGRYLCGPRVRSTVRQQGPGRIYRSNMASELGKRTMVRSQRPRSGSLGARSMKTRGGFGAIGWRAKGATTVYYH